MASKPGVPPGPAYAPHHAHPPTNDWSHSFWDCCSPFKTTLCGCCCPCLLFGRTQAQLENPADPEPSSVNGDCAIWCLLSFVGCQCLMQMYKRGVLRDRFGIEGSSFGDFCASYCCPCCGLVQENKEVKHRAQHAAAGYQPYQPPQGMQYQ